MLTRSGTNLGSNPQRYFGGTSGGANTGSATVANRGNWGTNGSIRNIWAGSATVVAGASIADTAAYPNGYEPPGSWVMAPKGGGLSAYNQIQGEGDLEAALTMGVNLEADVSGSGTITSAALTLVVQLAAALSGSGTISAALLQAIAGLSAALSGSGTISSPVLSLIVSLISALTGSGSLSANLRGTSGLSADIVVTGGALTAAQVATAVWEEALETGYEAADLLRIIAAAVAGKTSGGPATQIFRAINDLADRLTTVSDTDGNRTSSTPTP